LRDYVRPLQQEKILSLFGKVDFASRYDYKRQSARAESDRGHGRENGPCGAVEKVVRPWHPTYEQAVFAHKIVKVGSPRPTNSCHGRGFSTAPSYLLTPTRNTWE